MKQIFVFIIFLFTTALFGQSKSSDFYGAKAMFNYVVCDDLGNEYDKCKYDNGKFKLFDSNGNDVTGSVTTSVRNCEIADNTTIEFGSISPPPPNGDLLDNSSYIVTSDGTKNGDFQEFWKWDSQTATWCQIPDEDTNVSAHTLTLTGTTLESSVTEDGTTITDNVDLSGFNSTVTNTITGNTIATHNGGGLTTDIDETITNFGTPIVDTTDPTNTEVTLPYDQEGGTTQNVVFEIPASPNEDYVRYSTNNTPPSGTPPDGVDTHVSDDGTRYDWDGTQWVPVPIVSCQIETTRAAVIALRNSGSLQKDCHYVITNPNAQGTLLLDKVLLHAVDESTLSGCYLKTAHDNTAWNGSYDIDLDRVQYVHDHLRNNKVTVNASVRVFPWGVTTVSNNEVHSNGILRHTGGTVTDNTIEGNASVRITGGNFSNNEVNSQARVTSSRTSVQRCEFTTYANVTLSSTGNFLDNTVTGESVANISTTGNIESITVTGNSNLTMTGSAQLYQSDIDNDSQVSLSSQSNYNNQFTGRCTYRQVGTGWIRDSHIGHYAGVTNGNTNISRSTITNNSAVNTTGATGDITTSNLSKATVNAQNCPAFFLRESDMASLGSINANNSTRVYFYRSHLDSYGRLDVRAGSRIDASYATVSGNSYLQCTVSGGFLTVNNTKVTGASYVRNLTPNSNAVSNCIVGGQSNMRFDGTASGCRIYYSSSLGGASIYHTTGSVNCYFYYVNASSLGQIYTQNSTNARVYYCNADAYAYVRSLNNTATHYMYYCDAAGRGYVQSIGNSGLTRMYAVTAQGQSIAELRNSTSGNLYYSSFMAYFYAYITRTGGTSTGLFGQGRRSQTITNPTSISPYAVGSAWLNF